MLCTIDGVRSHHGAHYGRVVEKVRQTRAAMTSRALVGALFRFLFARLTSSARPAVFHSTGCWNEVRSACVFHHFRPCASYWLAAFSRKDGHAGDRVMGSSSHLVTVDAGISTNRSLHANNSMNEKGRPGGGDRAVSRWATADPCV